MKPFQLLCLIALATGSCRPATDNTPRLQQRIDSLEQKLARVYKPGFGEFMSSIQAHHSKLWFAGQAQNWKLCDFELHEIREAAEAIKQYETDRPESQKINMLEAPLDSLGRAIEQKDRPGFISGFNLLTNTCNNCHRATQFEFNVVKVPLSSPFPNQEFGPGKQ